jgi:predicted GNAT family acetyltransferase
MPSNQVAHVLDRVIWQSLTSYHAKFAVGTDLAKRYPSDMAVFAGIRERNEAALNAVGQLFAPGEVVIIDGIEQATDLPGWTVLSELHGSQMICEQTTGVPKSDETILELNAEDVPDILHLIELTEPGPFLPRTIELGRYIGIRHERQLIAMAGERLHLPGYHEISAVCTHPDFQGRGYARLLMSEMAAGHQRQGEISFLHVDAENTLATRVYESLGFRTRLEFRGLVMQR